MNELWIVILAVGLFTSATRILPLFLGAGRKESSSRPAWLDALGPCLLAAMAVAVILPELLASVAAGKGAAAVLSFGVVAAIMRFRRDPGMATLGGMLTFFLLG